MEFEIVAFVIKGSVPLTVPRSTGVDPNRSVALSRVFYLKRSGIHLTKTILKIWIIDCKYVIDVSICEVRLRCLLFLSSPEQRLYELMALVIGFGFFLFP